jgi:nucleotide-binding universal stress UspA family protein
MIKSILVCTDGSEYSDVATEYGIHLATRLKARILGLHVLDQRMLDGPLLADISGWIGAQPYAAQVQSFRKLMEEKGEAVIGSFSQKCRSAGLEPETRVKLGHPPSVILEEEARAELVVMGQKGEHAGVIGELTGSIVERVVRHSVKPCLVTPARFSPITRILVAYDGSGHSSKALQEAAELTAALNLPVTAVTVAEGGNRERAEEISRDAVKIMQSHACRQSSARVIEGNASTVIMEAARQEKCDFIVLGAYGHNRIREMMIGSTTTQILSRAKMPVMLVR